MQHSLTYKKYNCGFLKITFTINNQDVYDWEIRISHFDFTRLPLKTKDWRENFVKMPGIDEWLDSLFNNPFSNISFHPNTYTPYHLIYHPSLKTTDGVVKIVKLLVEANLKEFYPLTFQWIKKKILEEYFDPNIHVFDDTKGITKLGWALLKTNFENLTEFLRIIKEALSTDDYESIIEKIVFNSLLKENDGSQQNQHGSFIYNKDGFKFIKKINRRKSC